MQELIIGLNMKLKYNFAVQKVTDFWAAVPVGRDARIYKGVISLNETARDMMELLREDITEDQLVAKMQQEYDIDEPTLRQHVKDFIAKLQEAGVLE